MSKKINKKNGPKLLFTTVILDSPKLLSTIGFETLKGSTIE